MMQMDSVTVLGGKTLRIQSLCVLGLGHLSSFLTGKSSEILRVLLDTEVVTLHL